MQKTYYGIRSRDCTRSCDGCTDACLGPATSDRVPYCIEVVLEAMEDVEDLFIPQCCPVAKSPIRIDPPRGLTPSVTTRKRFDRLLGPKNVKRGYNQLTR